MITKPIGLYIHIPFCKKKCNYCDFVSFGGELSLYEKSYTQALIDEIREYRSEEKIKVDSIFFGGGTPSLLSVDSFEKILSELKYTFDILPNAEFTIETNPKTVTEEKLSAYVKGGVNRISIGLQTYHENELKILGRIHNFDEFLSSYNLCRGYGINNINVDLMYGIPEQTLASFKRTLCEVISLSPAHVSAYGLILEEGTPLFEKRESLFFPSEDDECEMYYMATELLAEAGYSHYEISNYAKSGFECRHNLKYWKNEEYIGIGLAAHSYFGSKRYSNPTGFSEYFSPQRKEYGIEEYIDIDAKAYEYAMMHLRLAEGFSLKEYGELFLTSFAKGKENLISAFQAGGYINFANGRISLTEKGFYVSNTILSELL